MVAFFYSVTATIRRFFSKKGLSAVDIEKRGNPGLRSSSQDI